MRFFFKRLIILVVCDLLTLVLARGANSFEASHHVAKSIPKILSTADASIRRRNKNKIVASFPPNANSKQLVNVFSNFPVSQVLFFSDLRTRSFSRRTWMSIVMAGTFNAGKRVHNY